MKWSVLSYQPPALPEKRDYGIGIIGLGSVARHGHLPAYRKAGYRVVAAADVRPEAAEAGAREWGIAKTFTDYHRLLDLSEVQIIDLTLPPGDNKVTIALEAVRAGKHLLVQKPFAETYAQALEMVRAAETAGVLLAVNQNARWAPAYYYTKQLVKAGALGELFWLAHEFANTEVTPKEGSWYGLTPRHLLYHYSVHHLDLLRWWAGREPQWVFAALWRRPGQEFRGELLGLLTLGFDGELRAGLFENDASAFLEKIHRFSVEGTGGAVRGQVECGLTYYGGAVQAVNAEGQLVIKESFPNDWMPRAFMYSLGELMAAITEGREPSISGRDNLNTLKLVLAGYASAERQMPVYIDEIA